MAKLIRFKDSKFQRWSRVDMDNGDPIYISIAQSGVLVKKSDLGILGAKLFNEKDLYKAAATAQNLDSKIDEYSTPPEMTNAILKALTQTALESDTVASFAVKLNKAREEGWITE